jgi:hypothetical protein
MVGHASARTSRMRLETLARLEVHARHRLVLTCHGVSQDTRLWKLGIYLEIKKLLTESVFRGGFGILLF